ncbi:MAG: hypothetical protein ACLPVW_01435 [Terriglobales bacterium]
MSVADYFLRTKHWQIFLLLFGMFCVAEFVPFTGARALSAESLRIAGLLSWAALGLAQLSLALWLWSLGSFLTSIAPPTLRLSLGIFRFALIYTPVYLFAFNVFFGDLRPLLIAVIFPLHLLAMFCLVYSFYFVSKSLVSAERGKPASFSSYAGALFLIWFFPIGVWIVQPRVNRLYAGKKNVEPLAKPNAG